MAQTNRNSANPYLAAFLDWFLNEKGRSEKSVKAYKWELEKFIAYLKQNSIQLQECNKTHIRSYLATRQSSQPAARARTLFCIRSFFKFLLREGFLTTDPSSTIDSPKVSKKVPQFLLNDEFKKLVKLTKTNLEKNTAENLVISDLLKKKSFDSRSAILAMLSAGIKKNEILVLEKSDFDQKTKTIGIKSEKNPRKVELGENQSRIIAKYLEQRKDSANSLVVDEKGQIPTIKELAIKENFLKESSKSPKKTILKQRDLAAIVLLLGTGIRRSELIGLDRKDYDRHDKTIRITRKGGDEQIVELNDEVCMALNMYLEKRTDKLTPLFVSAKNRRLSPEGLFIVVKNLLKSAGLKGSTHTLRHTFVTALIRQGVPLAVVQQLVGHKNAQTTVRYTHIISSDRRDAVKSLKLGLK